jgi:hypothetical protein
MNDHSSVTANNSDVIPQDLAIRAMRDSGYRNTAYALAELVDNAAEAEASRIDILCVETNRLVEERNRWRPTEIAVCDNGSGMDAPTLRRALQFGNGTRLNSRRGIGRFGMGLPNSSISQAGRVDVWTWQNGADNALWSYIDVGEISRREQREVPEPEHKPVPETWRHLVGAIGESGTLVVWSRLDPSRLTWKSGKTVIDNTEREIGRVHRTFIADGRLTVRLMRVREDEVADEREARINDPMYLTPAAHLPAPFDVEPMFEEAFPDDPIEIELGGETHVVMTRYSIARPKTVELADEKRNRGDMPYGKDADKNTGVSVMRAGRELMLDRSWTITYEPTERWWGCEVEFPPALDEIFGVTNNKQDATIFRELAQLDWRDLAEEGETEMRQVADRLKAEGDPRGALLKLSTTLKTNLANIRKALRTQTKGVRGALAGGKRHPGKDPTEKANEGWTKRDNETPIPGGDEPPSEDDIKMIEEDLKEDGRSDEEREEIIARVKTGKLKIFFVDRELGASGDLFMVRRRGGATEVVFNRDHAAFDCIFDTVSMDEDFETLPTDELQRRLEDAHIAVHILFAAWARMEREDESNKTRYDRVREDWSKLARDFLNDESDDG